MKTETLKEMICEFCKSKSEGSFYEFKVDNAEPEKIGRYISALSNSALVAEQKYGFLIYGVDDKTHKLVGTHHDPLTAKGKGNEDLKPWLLRHLTPKIDFEIRELTIDDKRLVVYLIPAAQSQPTAFDKVKYIRINSYTKRLDEHPQIEMSLWNRLEMRVFETETAMENLSAAEIFLHLNIDAVFSAFKLNLPDSIEGIIDRLVDEKLLVRTGKKFILTNLGAILFAKNLDNYPHLSRKKLRIIAYNGSDRLNAKKEWEFSEGYVISLMNAINVIENETPSKEIISGPIREEVMMYPKLAIREFLANALIHQDFWISGAGPMVEIFSKRIEITNPGSLLVSVERLIDCAPRSRNEKLAKMMRRLGICEERGSGVDRAIDSIELYQLPAPSFREGDDFFRVVMYAYQMISDMELEDRIRACYQHACLSYTRGEYMTNATLRKRLGIDDKNYPVASRILKTTLDRELIKIHTVDGSKGSVKYRKYTPYWG